MLLYHVPDAIREQSTSPNDFYPLAEAMLDYALFLPRIWQHVCITGTLAEFLSTALYQIVRRVHKDPGVDKGHYPTFELDWRGSLATRLADVLPTPPIALCPSIHQVIPIGVSSTDALKAMEGAIPKDIQDPYTITVKSSAVDDQCGTIAITQPMNHTIVNINCMIDPGILVDVCRELRTGNRAVVYEINSLKRKHDETDSQLATLRVETISQLAEANSQVATLRVEHSRQFETMRFIRKEMATLVQKLITGHQREQDTDNICEDVPTICSRHRCRNIVRRRFKSGKRRKQCVTCLNYGTHQHKTSPE
jgi:hypothetical protein